MSTIAINVRRFQPRQTTLVEDLLRVRQLAHLLDAQFTVAGYQVGWDAIIGLVPVVGDCVTSLIGMYPIYVARKHKLGLFVQGRMAGNLLIDWLIGLIPFLGDLFDAGFKANLKNAALLERSAKKRR